MVRKLFTFIALAMFSLSVFAQGDLQLIWDEDPIKLQVPVNGEKRINFPEAIAHLDVPDALQAASKILLTPTGVLHWTMLEAVKNGRVFATSISGSVYILDISSSDDANTQTVTIVDPAVVALANQRAEDADQSEVPGFLQPNKETVALPPTYIQMSQFAIAHHMGPERLIPKLNGAQRIAIEKVNLEHFIRMSQEIEVNPLAQWKVGSLYVTTLGIKNNGRSEYQFDPRALRGEIKFVASLHPTIERQSSRHNETVWALVTPTPFSRAVGGF